MTTSQMTDEIFRNLSILAEDEVMLARATKYLCKLAKEIRKQPHSDEQERTLPGTGRSSSNRRKEIIFIME